MEDARTSRALELMNRFADRTGLTSAVTPQRYLWTDAFAVCNFLGLAHATGDAAWLRLALKLVDQVHRVLGRHRPDDPRTGWISGLSEQQGSAHPTAGGLRIGKPLPERAAGERYDERLEWDRDGQYFHYLTRWMHALDQVSRSTGDPKYNRWARELAQVAQRAFTYGAADEERMVWKLSIDLKRALVPSMGQHDPLDGFVTCSQLQASASSLGQPLEPPLPTGKFFQMLDPEGLVSADPLSLGSLLADACRLAQLRQSPELIDALLEAAAVGLRLYAAQANPAAPAEGRLGFRELGLAIGLAGLPLFEDQVAAGRLEAATVAQLTRHVGLRDALESYWLLPEHRRVASWLDYVDINDVMLATSLLPEGFLHLPEPEREEWAVPGP